jgi:hypothetical protein
LELAKITLPAYEGNPLTDMQNQLITGSGKCNACHTGLIDETGKDVHIDSAWRSTMMENAATDPYWQATVRSETLNFPKFEDVIADKCATCHMGLAHITAKVSGTPSNILDAGFLNPDNALHYLAMDGVSCTLCHQIEATNYDKLERFSGGYMIDISAPMGERKAYGQFSPESSMDQLMQEASGFVPEQSDHLG